MFCHRCGRRVPHDARYCPYCQAELVKKEENKEMPVAKESLSRNKKIIISFVIIFALLLILCLAIFLGGKSKKPNPGETTTASPVEIASSTKEETTSGPSTEPTKPDHFAKSREHFYSTANNFAELLDSPASDFDLSSDDVDYSYNGYAYTSDAYKNYHLLFTGRSSSGSSRLKAVFGKIKDILPGRANYTYNELLEIFGDKMVCYPEDDDPPYNGYTFTLKEDNFYVEFTGPYQSSKDAGLDEFYLYASDDRPDRTEKTEQEETSSSEDEIRKNPQSYFANNERVKYTVVTEGDNLNVREFSGTEYEIISTVKDGATITVYGFHDGWAYVQLPDGSYGWVSENYIEKVE